MGGRSHTFLEEEPMMPRGSAPSGWTGGDRTTSPIVKPQQKREKSCIRSQLRLRSPRCGRSPASRREAGCGAHGQERADAAREQYAAEAQAGPGSGQGEQQRGAAVSDDGREDGGRLRAEERVAPSADSPGPQKPVDGERTTSQKTRHGPRDLRTAFGLFTSLLPCGSLRPRTQRGPAPRELGGRCLGPRDRLWPWN